jgi:hypothetical protein
LCFQARFRRQSKQTHGRNAIELVTNAACPQLWHRHGTASS